MQYFEPGGNSKNLETPWGIVLESGKKLRDREGISYHYFSEIGALIIHSENYFWKNTTRKIARLRASQKKKKGGPDRSGGYHCFHHKFSARHLDLCHTGVPHCGAIRAGSTAVRSLVKFSGFVKQFVSFENMHGMH